MLMSVTAPPGESEPSFSSCHGKRFGLRTLLILISVVVGSTHRQRCQALRGTRPQYGDRERMARDPVCGMVLAEDADIWAEHEGTRYAFCSVSCRSAFRAEPARFVARSTGSAAELSRALFADRGAATACGASFER